MKILYLVSSSIILSENSTLALTKCLANIFYNKAIEVLKVRVLSLGKKTFILAETPCSGTHRIPKLYC